MALKQIDPKTIELNPSEVFGKEWALLTAGTIDNCNTMTIGWGMIGPIWGVDAVTVYVRDSRYTKEFVDREDLFTLTFFGAGEKRDALAVCGRTSGRDGDKIANAGLTPIEIKGGEAFDSAVAFEGARMVLVCRKMFSQLMPLDCFAYDKPKMWYADGDLHTMYVGKIEAAYVQE